MQKEKNIVFVFCCICLVLTCLSADCGGSEPISTGDLEGLHSSGNGLGIDEMGEERESARALKINIKYEITVRSKTEER